MSSKPTIVLLGGGGHAAVVADAARAAGLSVAGCLDDARDAGRPGLARLGALSDLSGVLDTIGGDVFIHAAVGDGQLRMRWLDLCTGFPARPIVHPAAVVSPSAVLADGVFVGPRAVVNAGACVGRGVIINTAAVIEHDCIIGEFAHIAPGAVLAGAAEVGRMTLVGCGAIVLPGVQVGDGVTVAAGAVVVAHVNSQSTVRGIPARS